MIPTPIGAIVILIGLWLLFRPALEMVVFLLACSLFSGASAADLPMLGHSSLPPATMALGFLLLRIVKRDVRGSSGIEIGLRQNAWLLVFCAYAAVSAFILPRIFAGRVNVIPMQKALGFVPLAPSSQNITQSVYVLLTGLAAVAATAVSRSPDAGRIISKALVVITWIQVFTGLADLAASAAHIEGLFDIFRNGAYAQLEQEVGSFHRISGLTPEPSAFASLGLVFFVFMCELWLRDIRQRDTGLAALAMLVTLLASTSSTAYVAVIVYSLILVVRAIVVPGSLSIRKSAILLLLLGVSATFACVLALLSPGLSNSIASVISDMTLNKTQSISGIQRGEWARQGWDLFVQTRGLGVGIGSFRSSSLVTAMLGSVGPACLGIFVIYCLQVLQPLRSATYFKSELPLVNIAAAAGWTAIIQLIPATIGAGSADPGLLFALFAGIALAFPRRRVAATSAHSHASINPGLANRVS